MKKPNQISWEAPEFIHYEKGAGWYSKLLVFGILLLAFSIWQKDILMSVTFVVLLGATYIYSHRKPKKVTIELTGKGVKINKEEYLYTALKSFWIIYQPPEVKTLYLETTQYLNKELVLQLKDVDPNQIREFLEQYLPENFEREEAYSDKLMRRLKF